eukprot:1508127-Rhodomonas_salina.1
MVEDVKRQSLSGPAAAAGEEEGKARAEDSAEQQRLREELAAAEKAAGLPPFMLASAAVNVCDDGIYAGVRCR